MFDPIYKLAAWILKISNSICGNYVVALLLFAIVVKILMVPLGIKQQKNSIKQAKLRPKEMAIRKKYAGRNDKVTQQKVQQEIMDLYQKENFNPMGGCLPLLIQLPIIFILYRVITKPLQYICGVSTDNISELGRLAGFENYDNLKVLDQIDLIGKIKLDFGTYQEFLPESITSASDLPAFDLFGIDFTNVPSQVGGWLWLVPILTFVFMFFGMKISRKFTYNPQADAGSDAAKSMAIMDWSMPLLSTFIAYTVPATLGVYWMFQNILGTLQQVILAYVLPLPKFTEEDYKKAEKEMNGKGGKVKKSGEKKKVRSLHHIDDDDYENLPAAPKPKKKTEEKKGMAGMIEKSELKEDKEDKADESNAADDEKQGE
ncbi:MAG: YidC/Oxa1 family membrane protein insertase [Clostridia bacterium]|nr:YidC/Oxa1 family membrane protein insertase [Clostridia bacterium]